MKEGEKRIERAIPWALRLCGLLGLAGGILLVAASLLPQFVGGDAEVGPFQQLALIFGLYGLGAGFILTGKRLARWVLRGRVAVRLLRLAGVVLAPPALITLGFAFWHPLVYLDPPTMLLAVGAPLLLLLVCLALISGMPVVVVNLCLVLLLVAISEIGARYIGGARAPLGVQSDAAEGIEQSGSYFQHYFRRDAELGYGAHPNIRATSKRAWRGKPVYDVTYTIGADGWRVTPPANSPLGKNLFLALFGCSFAYGEGVEDDQTLAADLERKVPRITAGNFAFHGYGPQQMLTILETEKLSTPDRPRQAIALFLYIDGHISRLTGGYAETTAWAHHMPYYILDGQNEAERHGNFTSGRPLRALLNAVLARSALVRAFKFSPDRLFPENGYKLAAAVFRKACGKFGEQFDSQGCYVVLYPDARDGRQNLIPELQRAGVDYLDYVDLFARPDVDIEKTKLNGDGHPSPYAFSLIAQELIKDLKLSRDR